MKQFIYMMAVVLLASCELRNQQVAVNDEIQNELVEHLLKYKDVGYDAGNSIQKDELWQEREDGIVVLQDSVGVFHNIKGHIQRIRQRDVRNTKVIEFEIEIQPEEYFKIDLDCMHLVSIDSLDSDSLYNIIKALSDYTQVYVDGAVAITSKVKAANSSIGDKDLQFSYPDYHFNVVALSTSPLPEISADLRNTIVLWRKGFESILKNGSSKETDDLVEAFKKASENLSSSDNAYMAKYVQACSGDLYRE